MRPKRALLLIRWRRPWAVGGGTGRRARRADPPLPLRTERARRLACWHAQKCLGVSAGPRTVCTGCAGAGSCGESLRAAPAGPRGAVFRPGITPGRGGMYLFGWVGSQRGGGVALEGARNTCAHRSAPFGAGWVFWDRVFACARGCRAAAP